MSRPTVLRAGALNITMHPHSPERYSSALIAAHDYGARIRIRGTDWAMLGSLGPTTRDPIDGMWGVIYRFLNLDPAEPWLDTEAKKPIDMGGDRAPIIPEHIKPHLREVPFVFLPKAHRLFFDAKQISPRSLQQLFVGLFEGRAIRKTYGEIHVHVEVSREELEIMLAHPRKQKMLIDITLPNPDHVDDDRQRVIDRMIKQGIRRQKAALDAAGENGIEPDKETRALIKTAQSNGEFMLVRRDEENRSVTESTTQKPLTIVESFNADEMTTLEKLLEVAQKYSARFRRGE